MALNISQLASQMLAAALPILTKGSGDIKEYAETEFTKIAQRIELIETQLASGDLSPEGACNSLEQQKLVAKTTLSAVEGLTEEMIQDAINAALDVVKGVVNTTLGIGLIP